LRLALTFEKMNVKNQRLIVRLSSS
jgi:hypothetical protein